MAAVTLNNVVKRFGSLEIIHGASLTAEDGEFVVFVGPSGCGKSTLLRMIAGLEDISGGDISIGGQVVNDVEPADRGIAMVFQSYALYPGGINVELVNQGRARMALPLRGELPPKGTPITLGVRPEHFGDAGKGDTDLTVTVDVAEHLGSTSYVYAGVTKEELVIERDPARHDTSNGGLTVSIAASRAYAFDPSGNRLR